MMLMKELCCQQPRLYVIQTNKCCHCLGLQALCGGIQGQVMFRMARYWYCLYSYQGYATAAHSSHFD